MQSDSEKFFEVALKRDHRDVFFNFRDLRLDVGDQVVVESTGGEEIGTIAARGETIARKSAGRATLGILRMAEEEDLLQLRERRRKEAEAFLVFRGRIEERELEMKPVDVEFQSDGKLVRFLFTADGRVDFRELVRDLASIYRTRIELRQIGPREESKTLGGFGICGRSLCCCSFMREFEPIPSQAARDQNFSANSSKLAGVCGRLKCCLRHEHDFYRETIRKFPRVGLKFCCPEGGSCAVRKLDIFRGLVQVTFENGEMADLPLEKIQDMEPSPR